MMDKEGEGGYLTVLKSMLLVSSSDGSGMLSHAPDPARGGSARQSSLIVVKSSLAVSRASTSDCPAETRFTVV